MSVDVFRTYSCRGQLFFADGAFGCRATLTQLHDGNLRLDCVPDSDAVPLAWINNALGRENSPERFEGTLDDGRAIRTNGELIAVHTSFGTGDTRSVYDVGRNVQIGSPHDQHGSGEWRFAFTSVLVDAPRRKDTGSAWEPGVIRLDLAGHSVRLVRVSDYSAILDDVKRHREIRVTAELFIAGDLALPIANALASDLRALLSIAFGSYVSWICCDRVLPTGGTPFSFHAPANTRPFYGGLPLIDYRQPDDLVAFLSEVFFRYQALRETRSLDVVSQALPSIRMNGFLETRTLQALSILELMIGADARIHGTDRIVSDAEFEPVTKPLIAGFRAMLKLGLPRATGQQLSEFVEHLSGINFKELRASASDHHRPV